MACGSLFAFVVVVLATLRLTGGQYRFDCDENFCKKGDNACPKLDCKGGRVVERASQCGCCDVCIKSLEKGAKCPTVLYGIGDKLEECGPGLVCDKTEKRCVPASTKCINKQLEFDPGTESLLQQNPECDEFGYFKPVACIPDVLCYCVDKDGERIFGTDTSLNNDTMKCDCSRDIADFPREVADGSFPRCLPSGNYDPLQCSDEMCYCMDSLSPEEDVVSVNASVKKLSCYNKEDHENRFNSRCWLERANQRSLQKNESFAGVVGLDLVRCDLDGSYFPVQCRKNRCYCVNKNGKPYAGYDVSRDSKDVKQMTCNCLRDKDFLRQNEKRLKTMECDQLGNYERIEI